MTGEAIRLGQILKFFIIRVKVSCEGTETFFNLKQVCERKGNMNSHNTLSASHIPEKAEGNQLAGGALTASVWGTQEILWFQIFGRTSARGSGKRNGGRGVRRGGEAVKGAAGGEAEGATG
jgi:hypothetical protein